MCINLFAELVCVGTLDIPYKFHLLSKPQPLPMGLLVKPASLMRKRVILAKGGLHALLVGVS